MRDFDVSGRPLRDEGARQSHRRGEGLPSLKLIIRGGVGVDNIDVEPMPRQNGIAVKNTPRASSQLRCGAGAGAICSPVHALCPSPVTPCVRTSGRRRLMARASSCRARPSASSATAASVSVWAAMAQGHRYGRYRISISSTSKASKSEIGMLLRRRWTSCWRSPTSSRVHAPAVDGRRSHHPRANIAKMKDGVCIINTSRGTNVDEDALLARSGIRQGPRCWPGRLLRRAREEPCALQPSHGLLHAAHRRCHRGSPEADRYGDCLHHRKLRQIIFGKIRKWAAEMWPIFPRPSRWVTVYFTRGHSRVINKKEY